MSCMRQITPDKIVPGPETSRIMAGSKTNLSKMRPEASKLSPPPADSGETPDHIAQMEYILLSRLFSGRRSYITQPSPVLYHP